MYQRLFLLLFLLAACAGSSSAQQTDYETIVQPLENKAREFPEYLVQLAWLNNPEGLVAQAEAKNAHEADKNVRKEWLKDVGLTFNLNESNLRKQTGDGNVFFPRYNFGATVNVFNLTSQKSKNKISKRNMDIAQQHVNQQKLLLRMETLNRYTALKLARSIFKQRVLAEQEVYANYVLVKQLFETDQETFEKYTAANNAYYAAQEARLNAEANVQLAKYALEAIIGLKWEQVQHPDKDGEEK
ncbi:MAG TPA: TolC family protein [Saprospiraceae bacterium]|nr:TolC family protein [Saprospiraceae bacterium]HND87586.1 TolC family protein [Saprospiraceae bacterium]